MTPDDQRNHLQWHYRQIRLPQAWDITTGSAGYSRTLQDAIDDARAAGVIVVAAAGNDSAAAEYYPAALSGVMAVSATDYNDDKAPYSNFGNWVDLAAPGGNVSLDANGDGYGDGVVSTHVKVDALLAQGELTRDIGDAGKDRLFGMGLIDAYKAVEAASGPVTVPVLAAEPDGLNFGSTHTALDVEIKNIGAEGAKIRGAPTAPEWISAVEAVQTDSSGFGRYRISASRAQLADGTHTGSVRFPVEGSSDFELRASIKVGTSGTDADAGYLYILLLKRSGGDPTNMEIVAQTAKAASGGKYAFDFSAVPAGDYLIAAGADIDGDGFICGPGEACGIFPSTDFSSPIKLDKNLGGQDFSVSYDSGTNKRAPDPIRLRATP